MNKKIFIALVLWFIVLSGYPLGIITGKVYDKSNGQPLPGATIYIHEFEKGVVTDQNGQFTLDEIPSNDIRIEVSFLGYETRIVIINSNESLTIALKPTLIETPEVVVTASNFASQHENAVKIEAIHLSKLKATGLPSLIESLASIPGVDLISKGNGIGKPVIRGLSNSNVLFLNNGIKMENYQFSEDHPYVIDDTGIDRIEIIKGPASLLYGSDAIGGLINVLPEHPALIGHTEGDFSLQGYSASNGYSLNGGVKSSLKQLSWGIRSGIKNHRDYLDGNNAFVPNSRFSQQSAKTFFNWNNNKGYFKLSYEYNHLLAGMTNAASIPLVTNNDYLKTFWYQNLTNHLLLSKNTFFIQKLKFNANVSWQMNHRILNTDEKGEVDMQLGGVSYELKTWLPSGKNKDFIVGFQGANRENKNNEAHTRVLPNYTVNQLAIMGLYQQHILQKISLQAGIRYDYRKLHIPEQEKASHSHEEAGHATESTPENTPEQNFSYQNFSSSVGATYELTPDLLFRANVASAFRPPNVAELTQDGVHGIRYEKGNIGLKSQRNYEGDVSIHYHKENFSADVAGFYNYIFNYIFLDPTNTYEDDYRIYQYNQTNSRLFGSEFNLRYYLLKWMEIQGQFSMVRGIQTNKSNLPFIPHDKTKLSINFEQEELAFFKHPYFNVGLLHAFKQNRPSNFETSTAAYWLLNMAIGATVPAGKQSLRFTLNGNNLLNEVYYDHLSTLKEIGYYNTGRNIAINIKYTF